MMYFIDRISAVSPEKKAEIYTALLYGSMFWGIVHPLAFMLTFTLYITKYNAVENELIKAFNPARWWYFFVPLSIFIVLYVQVTPFPQGDMLRDLVAHHYDYDYSKMYPDSPLLPAHNLWIGFDYIVGYIETSIGAVSAAYTVSGFVGGLLLLTTMVALFRPIRFNPDKWLIMLITFSFLVFSIYMERSVSGRPELIATAWFISALFLRPWIWVALGLFLSPLYWLWPMYSVSCLLLNTRIVYRLICGLIVGTGSIAFWCINSSFAWIDSLLLVGSWFDIGYFKAFELKPINSVLFSLPVLCLIALVAWAYRSSKDDFNRRLIWPILLVIAIVLLPNYTRYSPIIIVLLCAAFTTLLGSKPLNVSGGLRLMVFAALPFSFSISVLHVWQSSKAYPEFDLPESSYLLAQNDQAQFVTIARNPGLRSEPALEPSASDIPIQELVFESFKSGRMECEVIIRYGFTHVLEKTLSHIPDCLDLIEIDRGWRLWVVKTTTK